MEKKQSKNKMIFFLKTVTPLVLYNAFLYVDLTHCLFVLFCFVLTMPHEFGTDTLKLCLGDLLQSCLENIHVFNNKKH